MKSEVQPYDRSERVGTRSKHLLSRDMHVAQVPERLAEESRPLDIGQILTNRFPGNRQAVEMQQIA